MDEEFRSQGGSTDGSHQDQDGDREFVGDREDGGNQMDEDEKGKREDE